MNMIGNSSGYYSNIRQPIIAMVDRPYKRVLDIGCGAGHFGAMLKKCGKAELVYGLEINQEIASAALEILDGVVCCDLNQVRIEEIDCTFKGERFDAIFMNDILEHLQDPWAQLADAVKNLTDKGVIIASIPNLRHWSVCGPLLFRGEFLYVDQGILDQTHLRFFTKKSIIKLFQSAGLQIEVLRPNIWGWKQKVIDRMTFGGMRGIIANQWLIRARKC